MTDICICILWRRKENAKFLVNPQTERWEKTESGWKSFQDSSFDLRPSIGLTLQWLNPHQRSPRNDELDPSNNKLAIYHYQGSKKGRKKPQEMVLINFLRHLITSFKIKYICPKRGWSRSFHRYKVLDLSVYWGTSSFSNLLNWITRKGNQVLIVGLVQMRVLSSKQSTLKEISWVSIF